MYLQKDSVFWPWSFRRAAMGKTSKGNVGTAFLSLELFVREHSGTYGFDPASDVRSTFPPMSATSM